MALLSTYRKYIKKIGSSPREQLIGTFVRDVKTLMKTNPSYFEVSINNSKPIPCMIVDDSKTEDVKEIVLAPGYILKRGDYVKWDNKIWLVVIVDHQGDIYYRGRMALCSYETLKWTDRYGAIKEYPCVFSFNTKGNFGLKSDRIMTLPDGRRQVIVQANKDTLEINYTSVRFVFNNRTWKVVDYDFVSDEGLVYLTLEEDVAKKFLDNIDDRLANYDSLDQYSIQIKNKNLSIVEGENLQLDIVVQKNGILLPYTTEDLIFKSTNKNIATVDENGLVTAINHGKCNIEVILKENKDIYTTFSIEVVQESITDYIEIIGKDSIPYYSEETFSAIVYINGKRVTTGVKWMVQDENNLVKIMSQNSTFIKLKSGNKKGKITLVAYLPDNDNVIQEKEINISGFL